MITKLEAKELYILLDDYRLAAIDATVARLHFSHTNFCMDKESAELNAKVNLYKFIDSLVGGE